MGLRAISLRPLVAWSSRLGVDSGYAAIRPVYAPALVAFVGGTGWQASFSFGSAPVDGSRSDRENRSCPYGASLGYLRAVNARRMARQRRRLAREYVNREVAGARWRCRATRSARRPSVSPSSPCRAMPSKRDTDAAAPGRPPGRIRPVLKPGVAPPAAAIDRSVVVRRTPPEAARARFRNAPQAVAQPRSAPVQVTRPGQFEQPVRRQPAERPPQERVAPQNVAPERVAPQPGSQPERRVVPPVRPQQPERVVPPQPERRPAGASAAEAVPQERVAPQPVAPQPRPSLSASFRRSRNVVPQERPKRARRAARARRTAASGAATSPSA